MWSTCDKQIAWRSRKVSAVLKYVVQPDKSNGLAKKKNRAAQMSDKQLLYMFLLLVQYLIAVQ
jgi:hypothetical protein